MSAPLQDLCERAAQGASGEFICTTSAVELHIYLQRGRVAWATVSSHPFEFARHLREHCKVDEESFKQVVEECRREKLPLGETMVAWGLVTLDDVKAALQHQAVLAITALTEIRSGRSMFLERKRFTEYDKRLTVELSVLLARAPSGAPPAAPRQPEGPVGGDRFVQQLLETIEGASWVELLERERLVEGAPAAAASRVPRALHERTLAEQADFVAVRSASACIIGIRLAAPSRSLWCTLSADSTFGAAVSTLWSLNVVGAPAASEPGPPGGKCPEWELGEPGSAPAREFRMVLERATEVQAALVVSTSGAPVLGVGRGRFTSEQCLSLVRRRAPVFAGPVFPDDGSATLGFSFRTMVTGERALWCFGAELFSDRDRTLWVLTDRSASQGLGWACLAALGRGLTQLGTGGPR